MKVCEVCVNVYDVFISSKFEEIALDLANRYGFPSISSKFDGYFFNFFNF